MHMLKSGSLGLSDIEAGAVASVFMLGFIISSPLFAHLSQFLHPIKVIMIGELVWIGA
jgi:Na+/melibiose symporter-like transporter